MDFTETKPGDFIISRQPTTSQLNINTFRSSDNRILSVELSYIGQDCQSIPNALSKSYGSTAKRLDLSFNDIRTLEGMEKFSALEELVLDNNSLDDNTCFRYNESLHTLSINKNKIQDIEKFLSQISKCFPNLRYLSLLGNPACPDQLSCLDKDEEDYQRYRYHVLYNLPKLNFLDSRLVKPIERVEANRVGAYVKVVRPPTDLDDEIDEDVIDVARYNPLPSSSMSDGSHRGAFGVLKYRYTGKHSEGNRFIKNHEL